MPKGTRRNGGFELATKSPLEKVARFLAAQRWSTDIYRPDPVTTADPQDRARFALAMNDYMDQHWREYIGPAQLLIRTCLKRPTRSLLDDVCAVTGVSEVVVLAVWDAGVERTASDVDIAGNSSGTSTSTSSSDGTTTTTNTTTTSTTTNNTSRGPNP
jgi:hypothetical protein